MNKLIGIGRTAEIFEIENEKILKLYFNVIPEEAIKGEYGINKKICSFNIPTAMCYELIQQDGRYGIVMDKIIGISMMKYMAENPMNSMEQAKKLAHLHASIHTIQNPGFSQNKEQLWQRIDSVDILTNLEKSSIHQYLKQLPEGATLCHGDFHPENVLLSKNKDYIIDWMTATQGDPCSDVAHTNLLLRYGVSPEEKHGIEKFITNIVRNKFADIYLDTYIKNTKLNIQDIRKWKLPHLASLLNDIMSDSVKEKLLREIKNLLKKE